MDFVRIGSQAVFLHGLCHEAGDIAQAMVDAAPGAGRMPR